MLTNLANAFGYMGDWPRKKQLLERALEVSERTYGQDHLDVVLTLTNLGNAYGNLGDTNRK